MKMTAPLRRRLGIGLGVGVLCAVALAAGWLRSIEEWSIDYRLRQRPRSAVSDQVRLVVIGDRDVGSPLGRWPFPRAVHADVLAILRQAQIHHCTLDILFAEPSAQAEGDRKLKEAIEAQKSITLAYHFEETGSDAAAAKQRAHFLAGQRFGMEVSRSPLIQGAAPVPPFTPIRCSYGAVNAVPDADGVVRRVPLFLAHEGRLYPSLAMQTVMAALNVGPDQVQIAPGIAVTLVDTPAGTLRIPVDEHCQYRVNFAGDLSVFTPAFQYLDLYAAVNSEEQARSIIPELKDRIVFIGNASTGNADIVTSPMGRIPGVAVQANIVSSILTSGHLKLPPVWAQGAMAVGLCSLMAALLFVRFAWLSILLILVTATAWVMLALMLAAKNLILPVAAPVLGIWATGLAILGQQVASIRADRSRIVGGLGRYVSGNLVTNIINDGPQQSTLSRRAELTVFFSDIRGFTSWTERMDPDELTLILNEYFSAVTAVVEKHGGTLDKFVGDCVMVFFGAPAPMSDHALGAVKMALEMQLEIERLNKKWVSEGRETIGVGMGVNTAFVTVGNFGSLAFTDYTVIGRGVNLAARVGSWAPAGRILLSARTSALVTGAVETRLFAELILKGIPEPAAVFEVVPVTVAKPEGTPADDDEFFLVENGKETGPFPTEGIELMRACGRILSNTVLKRVSASEVAVQKV